MDEKERSKAKISGAMKDARKEIQDIESDLQEIQKGLRIALSLYETAQKIRNNSSAQIKEIEYFLLDALQEEFAQWYTAYKTIKEGNKLEFVQDIKPVMDVMQLYYALMENTESEKQTDIAPALPEEIRQEVETMLQNPSDSGRAYILDNPLIKKLTRPQEEAREKLNDILLSSKDNNAVSVYEGYITPYEKELLEAITKFKLDGQLTTSGRPFATAGQIYRAVRGGGKQSPTKEQKEEIMADLRKLEHPDRKIDFELKQAIRISDTTEITGGKRRILSFDEDRLRIRGQYDVVAVFDDTPFLQRLSEHYGMFEGLSQDIKRIQEEQWIIALDTGKKIRGTATECKRKLAKAGLTKANITEAKSNLKEMKMNKSRIAMRNVIISFVWSYMRARGANPPKPHSNKLNYEDIFAQCEIGQDWNQKTRAKDAIYSILEHLKRNEVIKNWNEYTNAGDKGASGVQFFIDNNNMIEVQ